MVRWRRGKQYYDGWQDGFMEANQAALKTEDYILACNKLQAAMIDVLCEEIKDLKAGREQHAVEATEEGNRGAGA